MSAGRLLARKFRGPRRGGGADLPPTRALDLCISKSAVHNRHCPRLHPDLFDDLVDGPAEIVACDMAAKRRNDLLGP